MPDPNAWPSLEMATVVAYASIKDTMKMAHPDNDRSAEAAAILLGQHREEKIECEECGGEFYRCDLDGDKLCEDCSDVYHGRE